MGIGTEIASLHDFYTMQTGNIWSCVFHDMLVFKPNVIAQFFIVGWQAYISVSYYSCFWIESFFVGTAFEIYR